MKKITIETTKCNLSTLQPEMKEILNGDELFHIEDITDLCNHFLKKQERSEGILFISTQNTTTSLLVNEMHEPMVVFDMYRKLEELVPDVLSKYYHNSKYRTKNLETCDKTCDTNGAAHVKCMLLGNSHLFLPFQNNTLLLGKWQRVAFLDFDGPRKREILLHIQ